MTPFTTAQKVATLRKMISFLQVNRDCFEAGRPMVHSGLCVAFGNARSILVSCTAFMLDAIPELLKHKPSPSEDYPYWFDRSDFDRRIRICEAVIAELEKQLTCG